jgi:hypothetical protein
MPGWAVALELAVIAVLLVGIHWTLRSIRREVEKRPRRLTPSQKRALRAAWRRLKARGEES